MLSYILFGFLCLFETDFFIGLLHLTLDNEKNVNLPLIGKSVRSFNEHHMSPFTINNDKLSTYTNIVPLILYHFILQNTFSCNLYLYVFTMLLGILGNYVHLLCHEKNIARIPFIFKKLMDWKLLISRKQHAKHHSTFDNNFGLLNGWSNLITNQLFKSNVFRSYDYIIFFLYMNIRLIILNAIFKYFEL
jgi:hypothetical protein